MLPATDPPLGPCRTLGLEWACGACARPVAAQYLAIFLARVAKGQLLAGRTAIDVIRSVINEVLLTEASLSLGARRLWLRQRYGDAGIRAGLDLTAFVIAAVGDDLERLCTQSLARQPGDVSKLAPVGPDVGHVMDDDDVVFGIDGRLHVVADNSGVLAAGRHRSRIRIGQRDLLVRASLQLGIDRVEAGDLLPQLGQLVLEARDLGGRHIRSRRSLAIGGLELAQVARDALVDPLQATLHLGLGEVLVTRVHSLELRTMDGDARFAQQIELPADRHEFPTHLADRLSEVLAKIGDGLEVRRQLPRQPDQLEIALTLALEPTAGRDAVE